MKLRDIRHIVAILILAAVYTLTAKLGLSLAFVHASATAVWPPTGIALAALLIGGSRLWPGILIGAFLANATTEHTPILVAAGIAAGNTLESVFAAWLVNFLAGGRK